MTKIHKSLGVEIHTQITFYDELVKLFIPSQPITKGGGTQGSKGRRVNPTIEEQEESFERSIGRTKQKIREYVLCNKFNQFVTFTFKDNRYDDDEKFVQMQTWFQNQRKRQGVFDYILVPEKHKDGAYHFHALFKDYTGKILSKKLKNGVIAYSLGSYKLGISDVRYIKSDKRTRASTAKYLSKYITKDMPLLFSKKRYWCSRSLKTASRMDNPPDWIHEQKAVWEKDTENGVTKYLPYTPELEELRKQSLTDENKRNRL